jgi:hypothetical protein
MKSPKFSMSKKSDALAVPVDVTMRRPTLFGAPAMPILAAPRAVIGGSGSGHNGIL